MPKKIDYNLDKLDTESTGERIARIRKAKKITQQQLADKIGIRRYLISDYEQGRARLYEDMIKRIALILNVTTDELLGLKNHPPAKKK